MQNSIEKKDLEKNTNSNTNPKKKQLLLSKINIREKPILKKYLTQYFETPQKFFVSKFKNKQIILNKFKSPLETFELPIPLRLLKRYKRRKSKVAQLFNDTTMKEQMAEMASLYNNNSKERKRLLREISENKNKEDKREINDQEIQKIFMAFENVRKINQKKINNFITKNEYVDLMLWNKNENENGDYNNNNNIKGNENENEKNNNNIIEEKNEGIADVKIKKLIKSKSSFFNWNLKNDIENKIISSKIIKYQNKNNSTCKNYRELSMPKLSSQKNRNSPVFKSIFDEINPQKTVLFKNDDYNSTINSQYSTLYKTKNQTFRPRLKSTLNQFHKENVKEKNDILLQKQSKYVLDLNNQVFKKEILKKLASQEKALQNNTKYNRKFSNLLKILSKNVQKEEGDLILGQIDDYRIFKDIKFKLNNLMKNVCPENHYKWENELRKEKSDNDIEYIKINNVNNHNREITRNPYNISNRSKNGKIFKEYDEQYIRRNVPKTAYRKFVKDIYKVKGNLEGLIIEGQDLLKCEQDLIKNMKGKKVLINFKSSLKDKDFNDELYAYNIHINKYSKP
jgi:hypothetical protein